MEEIPSQVMRNKHFLKNSNPTHHYYEPTCHLIKERYENNTILLVYTEKKEVNYEKNNNIMIIKRVLSGILNQTFSFLMSLHPARGPEL